MQGTAAFHHEIAHAVLPQPEPVFDHATALDATVDMLDPEPAVVQGLVGQLLLQRQLLAPGFLGRHENLDLRKRERQEAQILQQSAPGREGGGGGLGEPLVMEAASSRLTEEEDEEQGIDQQDIFDRMVLFLATLTLRLVSRVLGADDPPCGPVMRTRGDAGTAGVATTGTGSSSGATTVATSASATPSRWARARWWP